MSAAQPNLDVLRISWVVLLTLLLVLAVSVVVFVWQVRRWTTNPGWRALLDWSRERGFKLSRLDQTAPEPLDRIAGGGAKVTTFLQKGATRAMQIEIPTAAASATDGAAAGAAEPIAPAEAMPPTPTPTSPQRWHVLLRQIRTTWPPTGLRPSNAPASLLDLFSLSSYPRMGEVERFTVFGTDSHAARVLSKSQARALLPPDIGLLLHGQYLVLDFSTRPFDGIELGRMLALADPLEQHLPVA
jgi:hypothetical protein